VLLLDSMKILLFITILLVMLVPIIFASQKSGGPKENSINEDIFKMLEDDEEYEDMVESDEEDEPDPCRDVHCPAGKECVEGDCECVKECGVEYDKRRHVCSNHNQTFQSDCLLYQARCWCETDDYRCHQEKIRHAHVEYYGECRQIQECSEDDLTDFPRRMREWLFNVMKDLADRDEISTHYQQLEKEAENDQSLRWSNAAVWQWCDLDQHPHDNMVSRHELFPLKAPLHSLEHCLAPFLDSCDTDKDHSISLDEWASCLDLETEELMDKCEEINRP